MAQDSGVDVIQPLLDAGAIDITISILAAYQVRPLTVDLRPWLPLTAPCDRSDAGEAGGSFSGGGAIWLSLFACRVAGFPARSQAGHRQAAQCGG